MRPIPALVLAVLLLGPGVPTVRADDSVAQIQTLVRTGQHAQAAEMADRVLAANAREPQARFLKAIALTELDRPLEAIAIFQKLTEDFPELPEPYNNLAVLYAQQREYDKARIALEMAIRTHPSYATAHENLGDVYARLASQAYDKALQLDSANSVAQTKLALIRDIMTVSSEGARAAPAAAARPAAAPAAPAARPAPTPIAVSTPAKPTADAGPAVAAVARNAAGDEIDRDVLKAVESWAAAWSNKDVKAYLSHYDEKFDPPGQRSRGAWEQERQQRIVKPGKISVDIEAPDVKRDGDSATVRFRQHYRSAGFNSSTTKTLELVRRGGSWRILQERVGG